MAQKSTGYIYIAATITPSYAKCNHKAFLVFSLKWEDNTIKPFLHNGKSLSESNVTVGCIDETWASPPLLPACPYGRAQARILG